MTDLEAAFVWRKMEGLVTRYASIKL